MPKINGGRENVSKERRYIKKVMTIFELKNIITKIKYAMMSTTAEWK